MNPKHRIESKLLVIKCDESKFDIKTHPKTARTNPKQHRISAPVERRERKTDFESDSKLLVLNFEFLFLFSFPPLESIGSENRHPPRRFWPILADFDHFRQNPSFWGVRAGREAIFTK